MKDRKKLYEEAVAMIENTTPHKESLLYHNIYSLQVNGGYPFSSRQDVADLVTFLNSFD